MNPLLLAVVVALLVPALPRGSYRRLAEASFSFVPLLLLGLGLQVALDLEFVSQDRWHDLGFGLLVASLVLVIGFCVVNLDHRGMGVVLVGVSANTLAVVANQGMPVDVPEQWLEDGAYSETVKHHLQSDGDSLHALTDIIAIPGPFQTVISFGDIIVIVGLVVVVFHASRRARSDQWHTQGEKIDEIDLSTLLETDSTVETPDDDAIEPTVATPADDHSAPEEPDAGPIVGTSEAGDAAGSDEETDQPECDGEATDDDNPSDATDAGVMVG